MNYNEALKLAQKYLPYLKGFPIIKGSKFSVTDVIPAPAEQEYKKNFQHYYIRTKDLRLSLLNSGYMGHGFEVLVMFAHPSLIFGGYQELHTFLNKNGIKPI